MIWKPGPWEIWSLAHWSYDVSPLQQWKPPSALGSISWSLVLKGAGLPLCADRKEQEAGGWPLPPFSVLFTPGAFQHFQEYSPHCWKAEEHPGVLVKWQEQLQNSKLMCLCWQFPPVPGEPFTQRLSALWLQNAVKWAQTRARITAPGFMCLERDQGFQGGLLLWLFSQLLSAFSRKV